MNYKEFFPPQVASFLKKRLRKEEMLEFLNEDFEHHALFFFRNDTVGRISDRIIQALMNKERVLFFVDYDADGVNSGAIFQKMADFIGLMAKVQVSRRNWGYGMTQDAMESVFGGNLLEYDLMVTADLGSNDVEGVKWLADNIGNRMDVIITDHHLVNTENVKEHVYALFNPQISMEQAWSQKVCGATVAMMIALDVIRKLNMPWQKYAELFKIYAGIATITDIMPLNIGFNRHLVKHAINMFNKPANIPFIKALISGEKVDETFFGFTLGPMLNALSRMNEDPQKSFEFLTTRDEHEALKLYYFIKGINEKRKALSKLLTDYALEQVKDSEDEILIIKLDPSVLPEEFQMDLSGINGLIAGRVSQELGKTAIVLSPKENGMLNGSGRSSSFSLILLLNRVKETHEFDGFAFGGHHKACGMKIREEDFSTWKKMTEEVLIQMIEKEEISKEDSAIVDYESVEALNAVSSSDLEQIMSFAPFGHMFPPPTIEARATVSKILKQTPRYKSFKVNNLDYTLKAFNHETQISEGDEIKFSATLSEDRYGNTAYALMCRSLTSFST